MKKGKSLFFCPTSEDCLGVNTSILEMLNLFKDELGAFKKRHYYELSNGRCAQAVPGPTAALNLLPNAFASAHINILPHYIYRSSWLSMSFATVSSTLGKKKKNKALNKNPLLPINFAHCSQRDKRFQSDILPSTRQTVRICKNASRCAAHSKITRTNFGRWKTFTDRHH